MRSLFALLISLSLPAQALEFAHSGFATYTAFSNRNWFDNQGVIAINLGVEEGNFAARAQVSNDAEEPLRRAALEYSLPLPGNNILVQAGRLPRLNTLFSDVYGNPDEWGMAVLPLSTYNRRKVHSLAFQAIEGVKLQHDYAFANGNLRSTINLGTVFQEEPCEWQREATRRPCDRSWDFRGDPKDSGDVAFELTYGNLTLLTSYNKVSVDTVLLDPTNARAVRIVKAHKGIDYRFGRIGLRYSTPRWYAQTEHGESRLYFKTPIGDYLESSAWDDYYLGGVHVAPGLSLFAGYSRGQQRGNPASQDRYIGTAYRVGRWAYTLECHDGQGSWQSISSKTYDWDRMFVGSITVSW